MFRTGRETGKRGWRGVEVVEVVGAKVDAAPLKFGLTRGNSTQVHTLKWLRRVYDPRYDQQQNK
jgi:hypothetical protein